jgi:hypothetical protein
MSFNALSLAKLGIGFGTLAVASIGLLTPTSVEAQVLGSGSHRRATEEELWKYLPDPYVFKPKVEEIKVEVIEKVFLPSSEVTPNEVATIAREVAKKFAKNTIVVEDDDEEAILFLLGVL